jgi:hypothetical protein
MENLINELVHRLEDIKSEERTRIIQYKNAGVDDAACMLTGKIMALDYCINELRRMVTYAHQAELHH